MRILFWLMTSFSLAFNALALEISMEPNDRVGDNADYALDKDTKRTSRLIKSGQAKLNILDFQPAQAPDAFSTVGTYDVELNYNVDVRFMGQQSGNKVIKISSQYFEPGFVEQLKAAGTMNFEDLSLDYISEGDVTTISGQSYPNCHKVKIYNIKDLSVVEEIFKEIDPRVENLAPKNVVIYAYIKENVKALGAVKLDIELTTQGFDIKIGFDII